MNEKRKVGRWEYSNSAAKPPIKVVQKLRINAYSKKKKKKNVACGALLKMKNRYRTTQGTPRRQLRTYFFCQSDMTYTK